MALAADKNETRLDVLFRHVRGGVSELDAAADRMGEQVDTFKERLSAVGALTDGAAQKIQLLSEVVGDGAMVLGDAARSVKDDVGGVARSLAAEAEGLATIATRANRLLTSLGDSLKRRSAELGGHADDAENRLNGLKADMRECLSGLVDASNEATLRARQASEDLLRHSDGLANTTTRAVDDLNRAGATLVDRSKTYRPRRIGPP